MPQSMLQFHSFIIAYLFLFLARLKIYESHTAQSNVAAMLQQRCKVVEMFCTEWMQNNIWTDFI